MMRTGKVLNFDEDKVYLMTKEKQFITVKRNKKTPIKDESYTGEEIVPTPKVVVFLSVLILVSILGIYLIKFFFFRADASLVISFNSNIKVGVNNNKIVELTSVGGDSKSLQLVEHSSIKGTEINDGLIILFDEALKEELLDTYTGYDRGKVNVYIISEGHKEPLNFTKFTDYAYGHNYDVIVNKNDNKIPVLPSE